MSERIMSVEIRAPALGESVTEATIARWFKAVGEVVARDEIICELETDKVALEVAAPISGKIGSIQSAEGDSVTAGAVLGSIEEGSNVSSSDAPPDPVHINLAEGAHDATHSISSRTSFPLSPAVRRLVDEHELDPNEIIGTGKEGRILKADVLGHIDDMVLDDVTPASPLAENMKDSEEKREQRVPMTRLRRRIGERLKEAQNTAAILTTFNEVDMGSIIALRAKHQDGFENKHNVRLGFMSFFVKASVLALKEIPEVNAGIEGSDLIYKNYYNIGVAVGTSQGLVVPVVHDADRLGFAAVECAISDLGRRARDGKLGPSEMTGGTFTITNGGVYGSLLSTPILNPPQSAILGMHKIQDRAAVVNGDIKVRPMMYIALSYDHRIIDGREAVTFLVRVKECLEAPERLLLEL